MTGKAISQGRHRRITQLYAPDLQEVLAARTYALVLLTAVRTPIKVAQSSPVGLRVRRTWRFKEIDLLPRREGDLPQQVAAHGRRPAYYALLPATGRRAWHGFGLFPPFSWRSDLRPVATTGLHKDEMWWDPLGTSVLEHAGRSRPRSSRRSRCGSYVRLMCIVGRSHARDRRPRKR
jgi:hypothetical protein